MIEKHYIHANELLEDSFKLAANIIESGFKPQFIVGIWRGGSPVGIAVQEYFDYFGIETDHIAVRTSSYMGINDQSNTIQIHGLHYIIENVNSDNSLLIVDDVFDTGRSLKALLEKIKSLTRRNMPEDIKIACAWYKPNDNLVDFEPDYYIHTTDKWLVFPHELSGLTLEEITANKVDLKNISSLFNK